MSATNLGFVMSRVMAIVVFLIGIRFLGVVITVMVQNRDARFGPQWSTATFAMMLALIVALWMLSAMLWFRASTFAPPSESEPDEAVDFLDLRRVLFGSIGLYFLVDSIGSLLATFSYWRSMEERTLVELMSGRPVVAFAFTALVGGLLLIGNLRPQVFPRIRRAAWPSEAEVLEDEAATEDSTG